MQGVLSWVITAILLVVAAVWVGLPIWRRQKPHELAENVGERNGDERATLLQQKEQAYAELKEIEFDYKVGKLSENDYRQLSTRYRAVAMAVLQQLEALHEPDDLDRYMDSEILRRLSERKLARATQGQAAAPSGTGTETGEADPSLPAVLEASAPLTASSASAPATAPAPNVTATTCHQCQALLVPEARFCPQCGVEAALRCRGCNVQLQPGDKFCSQCGAPVS